MEDPDSTPKLDKKDTMSQIISNLKWRFGGHSGRKKGKKSKAVPGRESWSSRLLWNWNGQWKDNWFTYENGVLAGYKEHGVKPADLTLDIKTSKLTIYGADEFMRKLNLFKITTVCNVAHIFAAWSEEQYETWVEILGYAVGKKYEQVSFNIGNDRKLEEESFDNDIIPYDRAMEKDKREKGKRSTNSHLDNIDSGNDGDESGLESSVSSLSLFETRRRTENERKELGRACSHSSIPEIGTKNEFTRSLSDKDLLVLKDRKKESIASAPSLEYHAYPERPSSLVLSSSPNRRIQEKVKSGYSQVNTKGLEVNIVAPSIRRNSRPFEQNDCVVSSPEYYITPSNQVRHSRQCSTDTYLHLNDVAIDSCSSIQTPDVVDAPPFAKYTPEVFCSEENISMYKNITTSNSVSSGNVRTKFEDTLREETLLRKRRNSLNLEREQVKELLDELREKRTSKEINDSLDRSNEIEQFENKMRELDKHIKSIDKRISLNVIEPHSCNVKKRKSSQNKLNANNLMSKLRGSRSNLLVHSHSVESLTSTASHDSSVGRESPYSSHKKSDVDRNPYIPTVRTVKEGTSDESVESEHGNGFEELLRTTQKLENGEFQISKRNENEQSNALRSKSMSAISVDNFKLAPQRSFHSHTLANAELIIEDFEKFSAMLMKNQNQQVVKSTEIIDV